MLFVAIEGRERRNGVLQIVLVRRARSSSSNGEIESLHGESQKLTACLPLDRPGRLPGGFAQDGLRWVVGLRANGP